jgi:hypothetical protein
MRVLATVGMLSVLGRPRPGKDVMSKLTPCDWSFAGAEATCVVGVVAVAAMA